MLVFQTLDDLDDEQVLMLQVRQDVADFLFALHIGFIIVFSSQPILCGLAVLAHHYEGRTICRLEGKRQIQEYIGVAIPVVEPGNSVERNPGRQNDTMTNDESPASDQRCYPIGNLIAYR